MNLDFLTLGGYGLFIWPAYIFTLLCCVGLYLRTKKALVKQEKIFLNEYREFTVTKSNQIEKTKATGKIFPKSQAI